MAQQSLKPLVGQLVPESWCQEVSVSGAVSAGQCQQGGVSSSSQTVGGAQLQIGRCELGRAGRLHR